MRQYQTEIRESIGDSTRPAHNAGKQIKKSDQHEEGLKAFSSCLLSFINTADCLVPWHRGPSVRRMEPLTGGVHLRELGTDRWVVRASDWAGVITRLLVEGDPARPSTEFIQASRANPTALVLGDKVHASAIGELIGTVTFVASFQTGQAETFRVAILDTKPRVHVRINPLIASHSVDINIPFINAPMLHPVRRKSRVRRPPRRIVGNASGHFLDITAPNWVVAGQLIETTVNANVLHGHLTVRATNMVVIINGRREDWALA